MRARVVRGDGWKTCTGCGKFRTLGMYSPDRRNKDGRQGRCKTCMRVVHADYQQNHPDLMREHYRSSYARHREQRQHAGRSRRADWRDKNRERHREEARKRRLGLDADAMLYAQILSIDPCSYCGGTCEHIDHIEPSAAGGSNHWDNLTAACASCNQRKRDKPMLIFMVAQ